MILVGFCFLHLDEIITQMSMRPTTIDASKSFRSNKSRQLLSFQAALVCVSSLSCETMITIMSHSICYDDTVTTTRLIPDGNVDFIEIESFRPFNHKRMCVCAFFSLRSFIWFGTINMNGTLHQNTYTHETHTQR